MPGICGMFARDNSEERVRQLDEMVGALVHEASYTSGTYADSKLGVYCGWATHEGSFSACLPVFNEKKDVILIYYGENFADKEVTDRLKRRNHIFNPSTASYLVHLYEDKGDEFFLELNGWFVGLLLDLRKGRAVLFNDRFGMQRMHFYEDAGGVYFSSEAKSILKVVPASRQMDFRGLGEFLSCGCALEGRTLFKDVSLLPAASKWTWDGNRIIDKTPYFHESSWENQTLLGADFFAEKVKGTLESITPRYLRGEQPIGISLTGGLDTRIIMAYLPERPGKYPCYTFGGTYRDSFDVKVAREVADVCKQTHQVITADSSFLAEFERYAADTVYISDGTMDVTGATDLYVNRLAKTIAPIRITGNYGSEVLRGVRFLRAAPPRTELLDRDFAAFTRGAVETLSAAEASHPLSFTLFKDLPWHEYSRLAIEQSQLTMRSPFVDNDLARLMYRAPPETRRSKKMSLRLIHEASPALGLIMTDRGISAESARVRQRLARVYREGSFKAEYAYNYGMPQWLAMLDHVVAPLHFERLFLGRHKFHHFRMWFRDQLSDYVRSVLLDSQSLNRSHLNRRFVEHMVHSHTKGTRNYTTEITQLLTVELTHRLLLDGR
jgi:asparagine synthase (glutamine-hydrolysing)